jgi:hypothetical protein
MKEISTNELRWVRPLAWGGSVALILLPLFVMKIADWNAWKLEDLPVAFVMAVTIGLIFELALRIRPRWAYRTGAAIGIATALLLVLGNLAVGFAGSETNRINVIFFVAPTVAVLGTIAVRFRPSALAIVMMCAAVAQIFVGFIAYYFGYFTGPLSVTFSGLWLASSILFLRSSRMHSAV